MDFLIPVMKENPEFPLYCLINALIWDTCIFKVGFFFFLSLVYHFHYRSNEYHEVAVDAEFSSDKSGPHVWLKSNILFIRCLAISWSYLKSKLQPRKQNMVDKSVTCHHCLWPAKVEDYWLPKNESVLF